MRGVFFKQPLEFRLEGQGDVFAQGDSVSLSLSVKNHGAVACTLLEPTVVLALANLKKVKAKDASGYDIVSLGEIERSVEVFAGQQVAFPCTFFLDKNCPLSDKVQSLYLLYGDSTALESLGALPLGCGPHAHIRALFDTFESVFGFTNKGESSKDGWTSVKLKAPDTRKLSLVEELSFSCRFEGEDLCIHYSFKVKKFDTSSQTSINVKRGKAEVDQRWAPDKYLFGSGFIQQVFVEDQINEALAVVSSGF